MVRSRGDDSENHLEFKLSQALLLLLVFMCGMIIGLVNSSYINHYITNLRPSATRAAAAEVATPPQSVLSSGNNNSCTSTTLKPPCRNDEEEEKKKKKVDLLSMERFVHPVNLIHEMNDDELLWRASLVPSVEEYPFDRLPKLAFMFLTRGPLPFLPLWEKFFKGHHKLFSIYVHSPIDYHLNVSRDSPFFGRQVPSKVVEWGTATLTDAERRLLANALLDFSNERFILLSESCIPIHNFPTVYKYLIDSTHSFVDLYDEPTRYGRGRYNRKMFPDIKLHQWRKGSQWFEMQRKLAVYIVSDTKYYSIFKKHCRPACYPDEHYIPTFINMFHGSVNANRSVTWVDWSVGGPHPAVYGAANVTEGFIQSLRNKRTSCVYNEKNTSMCHLFARKFSPNALDALLELSVSLLDF